MVEVENLTKVFDGLVAVDHVSFSIKKGEVVGFLGPNGAGKTTTLRMITGFLPPTEGRARVGGVDVLENPLEAKKLIGYLPENNPLYDDMLVCEYLDWVADIRQVEDKEKRIKEVTEICSIGDVLKRFIGELSKGYRQRVGLAQAILHDPPILIMDEPTSGLDPNQVVEIRNLIKELGKEKTVIVSTHILPEVEATCERVLIIHRGKIVADEKKDNLGKFAEGKEVVVVKIKERKNVFKDLGRVESCGKEGDAWVYEIESERDIREDVFRKVKEENLTLLELYRKKKSLEEIFRELTT